MSGMEVLLGIITWKPGIGDPTVVGWVTTIGYGIAAALCARAAIGLNHKGTKERSVERGLRIENGEDQECRTPNIQHGTTNIGMGNEECGAPNEGWPRKGAKDAKEFQTANDSKDANQTHANEIPTRASEGTAEAVVVPELELNNEGTGAIPVRAPELTAEAAVVPGSERGSRIEDGGSRTEGGADFQAFKFSDSQTEKDARVWFGLAMGLLFLGINKQLDLQTLLIQIGREIAVSQGWFEERRRVQMLFVATAVFAGGLGMITLSWKCRQFLRNHPMLLVGIGFLGFYVLLRFASIDHVEDVFGFVIPDEAGWLSAVELTGVASLALAAGGGAMTNDE